MSDVRLPGSTLTVGAEATPVEIMVNEHDNFNIQIGGGHIAMFNY